MRLWRWDIIGKLGRGRFSVVYLGRDLLLSRRVALKVLRVDEMERSLSVTDVSFDQGLAVARFMREIQAAGSLQHHNIITVYDVAEADGCPLVAMEYNEGEDLGCRLRRAPGLSVRRTIDTAAQVADGLQHAHARGIIHRDIKPSNIYLPDKEPVKILDFGSSRLAAFEYLDRTPSRPPVVRDVAWRVGSVLGLDLTQTGELLGTIGYMAPEQLRGLPLDARADLFSLGAVLYEMLTGVPPFGADDLWSVVQRTLDQAPDAVALAERCAARKWLVDVTLRCLAKHPHERFQSALELATTLRADGR